MLDDMFSFIDPMIEGDEFSPIGKIEPLFESSEQFQAAHDRIDAALSSKVREIVERQWGKRLEDLQEFYVGQFYERLVKGNEVSYRPTNRFILRAKFPYAREPRRVIFTLLT